MQLSLSELQLFQYFHLTDDNFIICSGNNFRSIIKTANRYSQALSTITKIINTLGERSATSQGLKQVITNMAKFSGTNQRIYIKLEGSKAVGFVKSGEKNLFYRDFIGTIQQIKPTCVLDIYVCESCQRSGYGKQIFQKFLQFENLQPEKLAYDRPSPKLISFLKKHYSLVDFIPQNNNFVVFNQYFLTNNNNSGSHIKSTNCNQLYQHIRLNQNNRQSVSKKEMRRIPNNKIGIQNPMFTKERMTDSLQTYTEEMERNRSQVRTPLANLPQPEYPAYWMQCQKVKVSNYSKPNALQTNGKYSLNMKLNDLSYRIPWGTDNTSNKAIFTTSSHTYGNYYQY